jgi:transposase InsO family protein
MPWKESHRVNERMRFVTRHQGGESVSELCREYGISRKTGYKFLERYQNLGPEGLFDVSRKPKFSPNKTRADIEGLVVDLRKVKPTWGAEKIRQQLMKKNPGVKFPCRWTFHEILVRNGLITPRRKRRAGTSELLQNKIPKSHSPNELWCADFKGQFRLGDGQYCYPLTITDHLSRYLLTCEGLENTRGAGAKPVFSVAFREYGLPKAILTDNGSPFGSVGLHGLSRLSVWWLRLGIQIHRIEPGHPEQNGRHERMHRTLKQETTRPSGANLLQQQERFDRFRKEYNTDRPHEALGMKYPIENYQVSERKMPEKLPEPSYPLHDKRLKVNSSGSVTLTFRAGSKTKFFLAESLAGELVGLREEEDDLWQVSFMDFNLGLFDRRTAIFTPT